MVNEAATPIEVEILVHVYSGEPCDLGQDPIEYRECQHGFNARYEWRKPCDLT